MIWNTHWESNSLSPFWCIEVKSPRQQCIFPAPARCNTKQTLSVKCESDSGHLWRIHLIFAHSLTRHVLHTQNPLTSAVLWRWHSPRPSVTVATNQKRAFVLGLSLKGYHFEKTFFQFTDEDRSEICVWMLVWKWRARLQGCKKRRTQTEFQPLPFLDLWRLKHGFKNITMLNSLQLHLFHLFPSQILGLTLAVCLTCMHQACHAALRS